MQEELTQVVKLAGGVDGAMSTVASSILLSYLIQWVKGSNLFPWITASKTTLLRVLNAAVAAAAAFGVHAAFDSDAGTLVFSGLTAGGLLHGAWEWGKQWAFQQAAYDGIVAKSTNGGSGGAA